MSTTYTLHVGQSGSVALHPVSTTDPEALRIVLEALRGAGCAVAERILCETTRTDLVVVDVLDVVTAGLDDAPRRAV